MNLGYLAAWLILDDVLHNPLKSRRNDRLQNEGTKKLMDMLMAFQ